MSKIKAGTTSTTAYQVEADTTGTLVLQTGATPTTALTISSAQVATFAQAPVLPAASIPQAALAAGVAGNGPAFSAYSTGTTTITANTTAIVELNGESYDTASRFNNTNASVGGIPAYAFMPNVAGYYQLNLTTYAQNTTSPNGVASVIFKNGSAVTYGSTGIANTYNYPYSVSSQIIYMNGTTDYVQAYMNAYAPSGSLVCLCYNFSGTLVRSA